MAESVLAVIPARFASRRFPGKPLASLGGKPLLQHVWERACTCSLLDRVAVATDDSRIFEAVRAFGGRAVMTSASHPSGTDRVAEVAAADTADIVVNVQGDEPFVNARVLEQVVRPLLGDGGPPMATLCKRIAGRAGLTDPNVVKVVRDLSGCALYFSRSPIPFAAGGGSATVWEHIGIYAFRRDFLLAFTGLPRTELEQAERLEQLRALEHGHRIAVVPTSDHTGLSVDTPGDLRRARQMLERGAVS